MTFETKDDLECYIYGDLGFCGCGNPGDAIALLLDALRLLRQKGQAIDAGDDAEATECRLRLRDLLYATKEDEGVYWHYLYWLDNKQLTTHGTVASAAWLTTQGHDLLDALERFEKDLLGEEADD